MKFRRKRLSNKTLPVSTVCRNCDTQTVGRYCHACGQDLFAGQGRPIVNLIGHLLENAFALDNKTFLTLRHLLFRPGFLSAEYRAGRINSYVQPVKLFWMSTIIFFALSFSQINFNWDDESEDNNKEVAKTETSIVPTPGIKAATQPNETAAKTQDDTKSKANGIGDKFTGVQIQSFLSAYTPYVAFFFVPLFALLLILFFWRSRIYYMYHLTFAVHFHSFLWILYSLMIVANILSGETKWPEWIKAVLFFLPGVYFIFALYRFYRPKRKWSAIWKALLIMLLYFILVVAGVVLLLFVLVRLFAPEIWAEIVE